MTCSVPARSPTLSYKIPSTYISGPSSVLPYYLNIAKTAQGNPRPSVTDVLHCLPLAKPMSPSSPLPPPTTCSASALVPPFLC